MRLEIHAADGGEDSILFASDLANAISKHSGSAFVSDGKVIVFSYL